MDLRQYVNTLRARWKLVVVCLIAGVGGAAALVWIREPVYSAETQLFVSTRTASTDPSHTYEGGLFAQQRVFSYAKIVSSPPVIEGVIDQLRLTMSVKQLQNQISASVPTDTVLIDVTVKDKSPRGAAAIANAIGDQFPRFVQTLETPGQDKASPVTVSVARPAEEPTSPVAPNAPLYLALGALLGLILGVGGAVLRELLDSRVLEARDAAAVLGAPVVGLLPKQRKIKNHPLIMISEPTSAAAEAFRRLRTNVRALSVDQGMRSLLVSSALPAEGKTFVVANLGVALAQAGHRVVVVDADLRAPRLTPMFGIEATVGLTNVLIDNIPVADVLCRYGGLPLDVVPSGPLPLFPSELLGTERFQDVLRDLADRADIVILDAPALLPVTDAAILAQLTSGVILVTRASSTKTGQLESAAQSLRSVDRQVLGVVMNWMPATKERLYGDYRSADSDSATLPAGARVSMSG